MRNHSGTLSPPFIQRRENLLCQSTWENHGNSWLTSTKTQVSTRGKKNIRGRVLVVTAVNDLLIQTNRTALQTCKAEEWTFAHPVYNFRRNHSNCSVIELYRTQSEAKHLREKSIKFAFRTQLNQLDLIERFVGGLRATRSLSVEVPGIWVYILLFFNLYSSSYVLFTASLIELC